jgi:hypothetical protein
LFACAAATIEGLRAHRGRAVLLERQALLGPTNNSGRLVDPSPGSRGGCDPAASAGRHPSEMAAQPRIYRENDAGRMVELDGGSNLWSR